MDIILVSALERDKNMANGELCKHCGHQETEHESGFEYDFGDPSKRVPGYRKSLLVCKGFVSENPEPEMSDDEFANYCESMEKQAEHRFAFGYYAAMTRQRNFDEKIAKFDRDIRNSRTDESEASARASKEEYIKACRCSNGIHIG